METVAAPRRRGRRVPDGDLPGGSRDPVAAIGSGGLPVGKAELSPLLPWCTRTTSSALTGARRAVPVNVAYERPRPARCRVRKESAGLEFFRRHLVHIYQDVFPFHLDPKHSLRNLRRGSDNGAGPNVEL